MWLLLEKYKTISENNFELPSSRLITKYTDKYKNTVDIIGEWLNYITKKDDESVVTFLELKQQRTAEISRVYSTDKKIREEIEMKWGPPNKDPITGSDGRRIRVTHWVGFRLRSEEEMEIMDEE